jgi:hypothetical protein
MGWISNESILHSTCKITGAADILKEVRVLSESIIQAMLLGFWFVQQY